MRYYDLTLTAPNQTNPIRHITSHPFGLSGQVDPGALNIEFDIIVAPFATPVKGQAISIEGISLADLFQAQQFGIQTDSKGNFTASGMNLVLKAGMGKGLPLANPKQAGIILAGEVWQSFGNWEGTDMRLDLVVLPGGYSLEKPGNIVLNWTKGTSLADALKNCLNIAYPGIQTKISISPNFVQTHDEPHFCSTLEQLASQIYEWSSKRFNNPISIVVQGGTIFIYDSTYVTTPISIDFKDLMGQPTWIDAQTMQVQLTMRSDLMLGSFITMPDNIQSSPGIVMTYSASMPSNFKYQSTFKGKFQIFELRHVGNFRTPSGDSWVTIANCVPA